MTKNDSIFRKKNLDKASAPEQLDRYIRVPAIRSWVLLLVVVVLLSGLLLWGMMGRVQVENSDGSTKEVAPITLIMNQQ